MLGPICSDHQIKKGFYPTLLGLVLLMSLLLNLKPLSAVEGEHWVIGYDKALAQSKEKNLPLMILFHGSDWCYWCIKLDGEVFSHPEFKVWASDKVILLSCDFPKKTAIDPILKAENKRLAALYNIKGVPAVILLKPDESFIARTGYKEGGVNFYTQHLQELLKTNPNPSLIQSGQ